MPDFGYKIKRFGWLKDYPSIKDYGPQETEQKLLSELMSPDKRHDNKVKSVFQVTGKASKVKSLPLRVDNRKYCSPVKDQGQLGSCTANMAANMYEYMCKRGKTSYVELSRLFIYKTTRWLLHLTGDTGAYIRSALGAMVVYGAPPEEYYPYEVSKFDETPDVLNAGFAQSFQVTKYFRLDKGIPSNEQLITRMKEYLAKGFCLGIGFTVFDSFEEAASNGGLIPYPKPTESVQGGHAVTIVGYDKNKEEGAFLIKNSWGIDWGERGYGWIPMKYFMKQENTDAPLADDIWTIIKQEWLDLGEFGFGGSGKA
ncbi:MAG TPA: C1 family peptidase [Nitrososphaeraceae archaeon]|jgi:C1A family cysteine protease|nr:C1 family peptidase [Nitrososphaeraceae archaeon]